MNYEHLHGGFQIGDDRPRPADVGNRAAPQPDQGRAWYQITAQGEDAEVRIYDGIGWFGVAAADFVADLDALGRGVTDILVRINSPGGSVFEAVAIHNALAMHPARVVTQVDSLAASAASFIAQAGDTRRMLRHSQMMIHNAQGSAYGDAAVMRECAVLLDQQDEVIAGIYAARSDDPAMDAAYYADLMAATTWMTADKALAHGLVDEIVAPPRQADNTAGAAGPGGSTGDNKTDDNLVSDSDLNWSDLAKELTK